MSYFGGPLGIHPLNSKVAGVDKLVICDCDEPNEEFGQAFGSISVLNKRMWLLLLEVGIL